MGSNPGAVYWMDMLFFTFICCKNSLKRPKINKKEAGLAIFLKKEVPTNFNQHNIEHSRSKSSHDLKQSLRVEIYFHKINSIKFFPVFYEKLTIHCSGFHVIGTNRARRCFCSLLAKPLVTQGIVVMFSFCRSTKM